MHAQVGFRFFSRRGESYVPEASFCRCEAFEIVSHSFVGVPGRVTDMCVIILLLSDFRVQFTQTMVEPNSS